MPGSRTLDVSVRSARVQVGLSQAELALQVGVTRQEISAIETGKTAPTVGIALRLARVLGRQVDELFHLVDELPSVSAELIGDEVLPADSPIRVQVAEIGGRRIARPLAGAAGAVLTLPRSNGFIRPGSAFRGSPVVSLLTDPGQLSRTVVAVGCDPAMGILADHMRRRHPSIDLAWYGGNSLAALEAVGRGEAPVAGTHLHDQHSGEYNLPFAVRLLGRDVRLVTFAVWEQGLMLAPNNPKGIHEVGDLARADVRLANREPGSGARALLDAELAKAGLEADRIVGYGAVVRSHLAAAEAVAAGLADAAVGVRAAAKALGLDFVSLARERYDLAIPARYLDLSPVQAMLETLTSRLLRLEVEALGGYDVSPMGNLVASAA